MVELILSRVGGSTHLCTFPIEFPEALDSDKNLLPTRQR